MNIQAKINIWRLMFMQIISMCFIISYLSSPQISRNNQHPIRMVDCLDVTHVSSSVPPAPPNGPHQIDHHKHQHHNIALLRPNEMVITKLGILQCIARTPQKSTPPSPPPNSSIQFRETFQDKPPNGPHVIVLPPIQSNTSEGGGEYSDSELADQSDYSEEEQNYYDNELNDDQAGELAELEPEEPGENEEPGAAGRAKELEGPILAPQKLRNRRTKKPGSLWAHFRNPLAKLQSNETNSTIFRGQSNATGTHAAGHPKNRLLRFRRQLVLTQSSTNDPVEQIIRSLIGSDRARPQQTLLTNLVQQAVGSANFLAGQLTTGLVRQTTEDLPIHMANLGQLVSNILSALTVNNPVLSNSPALLRAQQQASPSSSSSSQFSQSTSNSSSAPSTNATTTATTTTPEVANQPAFIRPLNERLATLEATLRILRGLAIDLMRDRANRRRSGGSTTSTTTQSPETFTELPPLEVEDDGNELLDEIKFVKRLNELTMASTGGTNSSGSGKAAEMDKGGRRSKRSLGSLLMFGPFSKFYLAMTLNRMLKTQSGIVSQAIVSELVRRYVIPGLGQTSGIAALLNQFKQGLAQAGAALPLSLPPSPSPPPPPSPGQPPHHGQSIIESDRQLNGKQQATIVDAECQLVNPANGEQQSSILPDTQLQHPLLSPINLLASAINNPAFSLDQKGLAVNMPLSQTSYLIPNLLTGPSYSLQSMLTALLARYPNLSGGANGAAFGLGEPLALGGESIGRLQLPPPPPPHLANITSLSQAAQLRKPNLRLPSLHPHHPPLMVSSNLQQLRFPGPLRRPKSGAMKLVSGPDKQHSKFRHMLNTPQKVSHQFSQTQEDDWSEPIQEEGLLRLIDSNSSGPEATILDQYLRSASPSQLVELMSSLGSQQPQQQQQQTNNGQTALTKNIRFSSESENLENLIDLGTSKQSQDTDKLSRLLNEITSSSKNQEPMRQPKQPIQSADAIADRILNRTLELGLNNLLNPQNQQMNGNRLLKDTSDQLAGSFAQLIRNLNFETSNNNNSKISSTSPGSANVGQLEPSSLIKWMDAPYQQQQQQFSTPLQVSLEPDKAVNLMEKLISIARSSKGNNNSGTTSEHEAANKSAALMLTNFSSSPDSKVTQRQQQLSGYTQANGHEPEVPKPDWPQTDWPRQQQPDVVWTELEGSAMGKPVQGKPDKTSNSLAWYPERGLARAAKPQGAEQASFRQAKNPLATPPVIKIGGSTSSSTASRMVSPEFSQLGGRPSQGLTSGQLDMFPQSHVVGNRTAGGELASEQAAQGQIELRKQTLNKQQQIHHQLSSNKPLTPLRAAQLQQPDRGSGEQRQRQQQRHGDLEKINKTSSSHPIVSAQTHSLPDAGNGNSDGGGSNNKTTGDEQRNLNNLAMALNVMNMVLLNQKLANGSGSGSGRPSGDNVDKDSLMVTTIDGASGRLERPTATAIGQPQRLVGPGGKFATLVRHQQPSFASSGKRRLRFKTRRKFPHHLYGSHSGQQQQQQIHRSPNETVHGSTGSGNSGITTPGPNTSSGGKQPSELEREGPSSVDNHRTIRNKMKLSPSLMVAPYANDGNNSSGVIKTATYHYQPLPVASANWTSSSQANPMGSGSQTSDKDPSKVKQLKGEKEEKERGELGEPFDSEHATRWNDVLQHLNLRTD